MKKIEKERKKGCNSHCSALVVESDRADKLSTDGDISDTISLIEIDFLSL